MLCCKNSLRAALVFFGVLSLFVGSTRAQIYQKARLNRYATTNFSGSYTSIGGTKYTSGDNGAANITLPFTFNFDSTDYTAGTRLYTCTNGWLLFGKTASTASYANEVGKTTYAPGLLPFSQDDYVNTGIYAAVTGTAPNRVFTIEWQGLRFFGYSPLTSMEVKLYETTNIIEFLYKNHSMYLGGRVAGVGLNGRTSPTFLYVSSQSGSSTPANNLRYTPPQPPPPQLAVSSQVLDFGNTSSGTATTQCITVSSVGTGTLFFQNPTLTGNPDFTLLSGPRNGDSLQPGQSAQYCVQFGPIAAGNRSAVLSIFSNGKDSGQQKVNITGFGIAPLIDVNGVTSIFRKAHISIGHSRSVAVPINSIGTGPLSIDSVTISGIDADQYAVARIPQGLIPNGTADSIVISYNPTFEGRPDALITIHSDAINSPTINIQPLGNGIVGHLVLSHPALYFDSVSVGDSISKVITLTNSGTDTLHITRNGLTSRDYDFTFSGLTGQDTIIAPDQTKTITVSFKPLQFGTRVATARLMTDLPATFTNPPVDTSQFVIQITGIGVAVGHLAFSSLTVDSSIVGQSRCVTDTVRNNGGSDFTFTGETIAGGDSSDFAFSGVTFPFTLKPGEFKVVDICLTPSERGPRSSSIVLTSSNGGKAQSVILPVLGYGLQTCASASPLALFGPAPTMIGSADTQTVTVSNCGDVVTTYSAALGSGGDYTIVSSATSTPVQPGGTASFQLIFHPSAIGPVAGSLNIAGGPSVIPVALSGIGGGVNATATTAGGGAVTIGNCQQFDVTIANNGNVDWIPGTATISGPNAGDFTIVSGPTPSLIPANGTAMVTVKYCPSQIGPSIATLTFPNANPTPIPGFSQSLSGTGTALASVEPTISKNGFMFSQSYPNPMSTKASITFTLPTDAVVRIDIVDQRGNLVQTVTEGRFSGGDHIATVDASSLPSGTYFYVLSSADVRLTRQFVVKK